MTENSISTYNYTNLLHFLLNTAEFTLTSSVNGSVPIDILVRAVRVFFEFTLTLNETIHTYTHNEPDQH